MDEKLLVDGLKRGDPSAQNAVWAENSPRVHEYLTRATRRRGCLKNGKWQDDYTEAHDILAQTFFEFFRDIPKFRGECKISSFLMSLARTNLTDFYRKYDQDHSPLSVAMVADGDGEDGTEALDLVDSTDEARQIDRRIEMRDELQSLSPTQRDVVVYRIFSGMTAAETGQVMNMSADAVDSCFYRAIKTLRDRQLVEGSRKAGDS